MGPHPTVKSTALLGRVDAWHRQRGSLGFGGDRERRTEKLIEKQMMRIDRFRPLSSRASVFSEMVLMEFVLCCQQSTVPVEVGDWDRESLEPRNRFTHSMKTPHWNITIHLIFQSQPAADQKSGMIRYCSQWEIHRFAYQLVQDLVHQLYQDKLQYVLNIISETHIVRYIDFYVHMLSFLWWIPKMNSISCLMDSIIYTSNRELCIQGFI